MNIFKRFKKPTILAEDTLRETIRRNCEIFDKTVSDRDAMDKTVEAIRCIEYQIREMKHAFPWLTIKDRETILAEIEHLTGSLQMIIEEGNEYE